MNLNPPMHDKMSDALQLADLEVSNLTVSRQKIKGNGDASADQTHDFNDSGSAGSFTPLPSIQNNYALEIKSFNNGQWTKPYS